MAEVAKCEDNVGSGLDFIDVFFSISFLGGDFFFGKYHSICEKKFSEDEVWRADNSGSFVTVKKMDCP